MKSSQRSWNLLCGENLLTVEGWSCDGAKKKLLEKATKIYPKEAMLLNRALAPLLCEWTMDMKTAKKTIDTGFQKRLLAADTPCSA